MWLNWKVRSLFWDKEIISRIWGWIQRVPLALNSSIHMIHCKPLFSWDFQETFSLLVVYYEWFPFVCFGCLCQIIKSWVTGKFPHVKIVLLLFIFVSSLATASGFPSIANNSLPSQIVIVMGLCWSLNVGIGLESAEEDGELSSKS